MKIILASASKNRQEIFDIAQIPVTLMPTKVDEKQVKQTDLKKRALAIARLKMAAAKSNFQDDRSQTIIIAADGFNVCQGKILDKPHSLGQAREMLDLLSGNKTTFYSALIMYHCAKLKTFETIVTTDYWFRNLSNEEITDYITTTDVLQYSAAYSPLNTKAVSFGRKIAGSLTGFTHSMPMDIVIPKLIEWGWKKT